MLEIAPLPPDLVAEIEARVALPPPAERRAIREAAGVSQERLGEALGVRGATIWEWETGRTPRPHNAVKYARALRALKELS